MIFYLCMTGPRAVSTEVSCRGRQCGKPINDKNKKILSTIGEPIFFRFGKTVTVPTTGGFVFLVLTYKPTEINWFNKKENEKSLGGRTTIARNILFVPILHIIRLSIEFVCKIYSFFFFEDISDTRMRRVKGEGRFRIIYASVKTQIDHENNLSSFILHRKIPVIIYRRDQTSEVGIKKYINRRKIVHLFHYRIFFSLFLPSPAPSTSLRRKRYE